MDPPPRSRWWAHELSAARARSGFAAGGEEAAMGSGEGDSLRKAMKRKGSRGSGGAERAKKRQKALQFSLFLKHKERTSKPQSASCSLQNVFYKGLRKHTSCTTRRLRELAVRKKLQERQDHTLTCGNSLKKQCVRGMDHKLRIKVSRPINYPPNSGCEVVKHVAYPPKDDIFGDLPLLESSKIMFHTGVDILPTVIEDPFAVNQSVPDAILGTEPLKLMPASEISKQTPLPFEDFVKKEGTPEKETTCISPNDVGKGHSSNAEFDGLLNHGSDTIGKTYLGEMQMKSTNVSALSSYSNEGAKSCSNNNSPRSCFYTNTNCFQRIKKTGTSSAAVRTRIEETKNDRDAAVIVKTSNCISGRQVPNEYHLSSEGSVLSSAISQGAKSCSSNPPQSCFYMGTNCVRTIKKTGTSSAAVRTRIEATKNNRDAAVIAKKRNYISGRQVPTEYHLSSEGSLVSSAISQGTVNAGTNTDGLSSCRSVPAQEYVSTSSPFYKFASNACDESRKSVDTCASSSVKDQGSLYPKHQPAYPSASIGLAFMKLPGLERMEISSHDPRTGENKFMNGLSLNTRRCQEQQMASGMTNIIQGQNMIGFSDSQAGKKVPDCFVRQDNFHSHQPTMRLMGKTVSVCERVKEHKLSTTGKVWIDSSITEEDRPSPVSCQLPQKRLCPYPVSVIPRACVNESSYIFSSISNSTLAEARPIASDAQNQRLQLINSVSSTVKDHISNPISHFVCQAQINKESVIDVNSRTRHLELYQPQKLMNVPQNQYPHLNTPASSMYMEDHTSLGSAVNHSSPSFPQRVLNTSMQGKYQKCTSLGYEDTSSVPTHKHCQVPGANLLSTSIVSFREYGTNSAELRNSYQAGRPSVTTSSSSKSIPTISPTCTGSLFNIDGRKGVSFINQSNKRPACADNVLYQPAKRQLVADKLELTTPMVPNIQNYSLGWSLNDAVGPRILDFSNK